MLIRIVQGGYGLKIRGRNKLILAGQTAELPDGEASRLISLGVAEAIKLVTDAETAPADVPADEAGNFTPDAENAAEGQETAHLDEADLMANYTVPQLKALAAEMEIDISKCDNKSEIAAAIAAVDVEPGPELSAEEPTK